MSMTDEERIKMISQSYMNLEVNKKISVNRQTYGYVSKIIDNKKSGEKSFIITDGNPKVQKPKEVKQITILYQGSIGINKILVNPGDVWRDWGVNNLPTAVQVINAGGATAMPQLKSAAHTLQETMQMYPNAKVSVYGHSLGSMNGQYELRWFTPDREIDLCGHATLATAFVLFNYYGVEEETIKFTSQSGELLVTKQQETYYMDFPSIMPKKVAILPEYEKAIGAKIKAAYLARDLFFELTDEETVKQLQPNFSAIKNFDLGVGVIVTARGQKEDFVSRTFFPKLTINEDPVCGSAHSNLIPYWANKLSKKKMIAHQLSPRGGYLDCELRGERIMIGGEAVLFAQGEGLYSRKISIANEAGVPSDNLYLFLLGRFPEDRSKPVFRDTRRG